MLLGVKLVIKFINNTLKMRMRSSINKYIPFLNHDLNFDSVISFGIKSLYRFTCFDPDNFYQDLLNNILFFPSMSQLNDPFDAQIPIKYELCSKKELDNYITELLKSRGVEDPDQTSKLIEAKNKIKNYPSLIQEAIENETEKRVGILSLSSSRDNLLLWAHYAAKHSGFCVELDAQLLHKIIVIEFLKNKEMAFLFQVKYQKRFPIINPCKNTFSQRVLLQLLTKSKDWKYEREWRILILNGSKQKISIPANVIKNIYFGLKTSDKNIRTSKKILKSSNPYIGLYQAVKKKDVFGLGFERLNF